MTDHDFSKALSSLGQLIREALLGEPSSALTEDAMRAATLLGDATEAWLSNRKPDAIIAVAQANEIFWGEQ